MRTSHLPVASAVPLAFLFATETVTFCPGVVQPQKAFGRSRCMTM